MELEALGSGGFAKLGPQTASLASGDPGNVPEAAAVGAMTTFPLPHPGFPWRPEAEYCQQPLSLGW